MTDLTQAFFTDLAKRHYDPLLHSISGTIRWDIEEKGNYFVTIKKGEITVTKEKKEADAVCTITKEDFENSVIGKQNIFTLFLQMKMTCEGNLGFLQIFQRVFPDKNLMKGAIHEQNN